MYNEYAKVYIFRIMQIFKNLEEIIMFKRIMSVMLAIVMLMSVAMVATSAAQVEIADNSADVVSDGAADTGAEGDAADTGAANTFNFDANSAGWNNFKKIFCHVWVYGGDAFYAWQAKGEACTDKDGDGIWTYDLDAKKVSLDPNTLYAVIFSNENGMQTYNLLAGTACIGDTAYCDGTTYENPEDSSKTAQAAFWQGQDSATYGPEMCVTSIGNVVGTCCPSTTSRQGLFEGFLTNNLENARTYSGKDDQTLIDDTAKALGLKQENVTEGIKNTGVSVAWDASKSSLETGKDDSASDTPAGGNTSNSGGSSNKNGSTTKTGQESTVLFIMLGVMLAAAGVIFLGRKERA